MIGFGFAGCGAGVIPGGCAGAQLRGPVLGPDPTPLADLQWSYGSIYAGSFLGMLVGGALGVRYARSARHRVAGGAPDAAPGTSPAEAVD
jgi:hypothetical protein